MMNEKVLSPQDVEQLRELFNVSSRVVVTCHMGPDGDAVGSMTATVALLRKLGKHAVGIAPNAWPDNLAFMDGAEELVRFVGNEAHASELIDGADLVVCLDYNALHRTGDDMGHALSLSKAPRIMIDHHLEPEADGWKLVVSQPQMSSTCEVLMHVMAEMGWLPLLDCDMATSLYTGIMTDTGGFSYASSRGEVFRCVALLLDQGIDKDAIYRRIFWGCSEGRMRMMGFLLYAKMQLLKKRHTSIITMTNQEYRRMHLKNGDTEGFVNLPLQIEGVRLSIFLREDTEVAGRIRLSMRSVDPVPCHLLAQDFFNGGGHKNAAGGTVYCSLDEAVEQAKRAVEAYAQYLKD